MTAGWTYNDGKAHGAIDLRAKVGAPVFAAERGTVTWVQKWNGYSKTGNQSYGNLVRLQHEHYNGARIESYCAHLSAICVQYGEVVEEGQLIGYSGQTGNCYGAHLHFEVRYNGKRVNPLNWLKSDFKCANDGVQAHLGKYVSVVVPDDEVPAVPLFEFVTQCTKGDAGDFEQLAKAKEVDYTLRQIEGDDRWST